MIAEPSPEPANDVAAPATEDLSMFILELAVAGAALLASVLLSLTR